MAKFSQVIGLMVSFAMFSHAMPSSPNITVGTNQLPSIDQLRCQQKDEWCYNSFDLHQKFSDMQLGDYFCKQHPYLCSKYCQSTGSCGCLSNDKCLGAVFRCNPSKGLVVDLCTIYDIPQRCIGNDKGGDASCEFYHEP